MITSRLLIFTMASSFCNAYWNLFESSNFCAERQCREPPTIPITQYLVVKAASPLYVSILPRNSENEHVDNICYSYFEPRAGYFLLYQSVVHKNGSNTLYADIEFDVPGRLGVLRGADPTCTYQEYAIQLGCELNFVLYRCFIGGECNRGVVTLDPGFDSIYAVSNVNKFTPSCQEILIKQIQETVGFNTTEHVALPNNLHNKCVGLLNGAKCIGFHKLDEKDYISVNTQEDSTKENFKQELDETLDKISTYK